MMETYNEYISKFKVYPTWKAAQKKGFEAHHIVPQAIQKDSNEFDDRCVRLTAFQHIYAHYLLAFEDKKAAVIFALMVNFNFDKLSELDKITLEQLEDWARLREEGWSNPEFVKAVSEKSKQYWAKEGTKEHHSNKMKEFYSHPENKQILSDLMNQMYDERPEIREIISQKSKQKWSNPEYKQRLSEKFKEIQSTDEMKQRLSTALKDYYSDEDNKQKQSEKSVEYWSSEEARSHQSDIMKATKWWNNGQINTRSKDCPEGFVPGRLKKS